MPSNRKLMRNSLPTRYPTTRSHVYVAACRATGEPQSGAIRQIERRDFITSATLAVFASWASPTSSAAEPAFLDGEAGLAVNEALAASVPKGKAPAVLRVVFHDAGTYDAKSKDGGANASVRYELGRPENKGLKRGLNCVTAAMDKIKGTAADGKVSFSDMIALAGAYAVAITGGPKVPVPIGRMDASSADPENRLPSENASIAELKRNFASKGFTTQEFVALSGSHTIGGKGFGEPLIFDNAYYQVLMKKPWNDPSVEMGSMIGLESDHVLADDKECLDIIELYAEHQDVFFEDFTSAYLKLSGLGTL
ncbi:uncharacterized protein LOC142358193 [Convolutriloba macropyga]|uniref:uncharacterized protein LOC142358193 n=1 Tax=Convolutriloba macropyga TaxID=536237 RepID=UPI003F5281B0